MSPWWALPGLALWVPMLIALFGKDDTHGCPDCHHETGGVKGCDWTDHDNGWSSTPCDCASDYHAKFAAHPV